MTTTRRISRRWTMRWMLAAGMLAYGLAGFPTPDTSLREAHAASCLIFCSDFTTVIQNDDGTTTTHTYDYDSGTLTSTHSGGEDPYTPRTYASVTTTTPTTVYTSTHDKDGLPIGTTTTDRPPASSEPSANKPASREDIAQSFLDHDGVNGRNGHAGVDALKRWYAERGQVYSEVGTLDRDAVNYGHCVSFGLSGCSLTDPAATQQVMYRQGVSLGYSNTGTYSDFGGDDQTTNYENSVWFGRCPKAACGGGYTPPGGHRPLFTTTVSLTPPPTGCRVGFSVIAAHVDTATGDDGCRPDVCDFGRDADGWCEQPDPTDTPLVYVFGGGHVSEGHGDAEFRVVTTHAFGDDITVEAATADGTATAGSDYTAVTRTVTIPSGDTTVTVAVDIIDDGLYEPDEETFTLDISSPSANAALGPVTQARATIVDNELPVPQNLSAVCSAAPGPHTITVTWTGDPVGRLDGATERVWLRRQNPDGTTTTVGADLLPSANTSTFANLATDTRYEATIEWSKDLPGTATVLRSRASVETACGNVLDPLTVDCYDTGSGLVLRLGWDQSLGAEDVLMVSGSSLGDNTHHTFNIEHTYTSLAEGSDVTGFSIGGSDYTFADVRDPASTTWAQAAVQAPTTYRFSLPNQPSIAVADITIPGSHGPLVLVCGAPPSVSVAATALTVDEGAGDAVVTVRLSAAQSADVTVDVNTADGTATAGSDYTAVTARTVTISAGQTTANVLIPILDDSADEPDESFTVTLSNPSNATLGADTATVTITDNDDSSGDDGWSL